MKQVFLGIFFVIALFGLASVVPVCVFATMDYLECSSGCNCKVGGECRCLGVMTATCQCGDCNCTPEQVLSPLSELEFEELKSKLKAAGYQKQKPCCSEGK